MHYLCKCTWISFAPRAHGPLLQLAPPKQKQPSIIARLLGAIRGEETRTQTHPRSYDVLPQESPPSPSE